MKEGNLSLPRKNSRTKKKEIKKEIKTPKKKLILQDELVLKNKKSAKSNGKSRKKKYACLICTHKFLAVKKYVGTM